MPSTEFYREQFNFELPSQQIATRHTKLLIPKLQESIRMFDITDCVTLLDLPASFVIS